MSRKNIKKYQIDQDINKKILILASDILILNINNK